jgi:MFS family permease
MAETPRKGTPTGHEEPLTVVKIDEKASSQSLGPRDPASQDSAREESPYTTLRNKEKIFTIILASFAAFILPVSSSIYLPALNALAKELNVTSSRINITITVYILIQGLAPTFIGSISDKNGRRSAFLICFALYLGANIGLARQKNYAALMALRCLQASGSSELPFTGIFLPASGQLAADIHNSGGTVALGSVVVADIVTRAERGKYIGYASMGVTLGPALGPIIGGLLTHYLGWRFIF